MGINVLIFTSKCRYCGHQLPEDEEFCDELCERDYFVEMGNTGFVKKYVPNDYPDESYNSFGEMMKAHPEFEEMDEAQYHVVESEEPMDNPNCIMCGKVCEDMKTIEKSTRNEWIGRKICKACFDELEDKKE